MAIKRGEIYYADLNPVKGHEQGGVRPVLILQNNLGNTYSPTTIVAPITSKVGKTVLPTHVAIKAKGLPVNSLVLLEHICTMDNSRLQNCVGFANDETMEKVDMALSISLSLIIEKNGGNKK